ncbi:hypothetical protein GCM10010326_68250 [Streptomyces xanthochromogenes]|uniref:CdiI immunity protein domain-containing protein n=1 Tax=Streptomyces xanthochromogenes TaxID=67384 RepID=A0ABQ3AS92_9ACTN|nr:hypothetical protein GCM10010326_68250 [Streptomyces xanthochromogenes]
MHLPWQGTRLTRETRRHGAGPASKAVGELHELLALGLDEAERALAVAELGMEVDPPAPYSPGAWLALVAQRLG